MFSRHNNDADGIGDDDNSNYYVVSPFSCNDVDARLTLRASEINDRSETESA